MNKTIQYPIGKFNYPDQVSDLEIDRWIADIESLPLRLIELIGSLNQQQLDLSYRDNGWTVRQVVHHIADSHINGYIRFHWTVTEELPLIKAYDQDRWATLPYQFDLPLEISLNIIEAIHLRWVFMLKKLSPEDLNRVYIHPEDKRTISLKQAIALYAWHGSHHVGHIQLVKENYSLVTV